MRIILPTLKSLLQNNVAEIIFVRRRPQLKQFRSLQRHMLCTTDMNILNSVNGRMALNFRPPTGLPPYDPESKGLLCVWDIFMQDYRMVPMEACDLMRTIAGNEFWDYFNNELLKMTPNQKLAFMEY